MIGHRVSVACSIPLLTKHIFYFHIKGGTQAILKPVSEIKAQVLCTIMGYLIMTSAFIMTSCNETKEVLEGKFTVPHTSLILPFIISVAEDR
jgi:hypothetical protein